MTCAKYVLALPLSEDEARAAIDALQDVSIVHGRAAEMFKEVCAGVGLDMPALEAMAGLSAEALRFRADRDGEALSVLADKIDAALREAFMIEEASA